MRTLILGMGIQGNKRKKYCEKDFIGFVDPFNPEANYKDIKDVPIQTYDAVLACIPDDPKFEIINYCLDNNKHILVEKPLILDESKFKLIKNKIEVSNALCYIAYNHRFEPHFVKMKNLLETNILGSIYNVRMFYGNGTAQLVRDSIWRDEGKGVLSDLGSHLLDICNFWFGSKINYKNWKIVSCNNFENRSPDHCILINSDKDFQIELEMTMLMWKNNFTCDILAEKGSVHIESLCKWGPSKFILRKRKYPSGIPNEEQSIIINSDPTWLDEYKHFKELICNQSKMDINWHNNLNTILNYL